MPSPLVGKWSLSSLLDMTLQTKMNRIEYAYRDVVKSSIKVKKTSVYDGKNPGQSRTRFDIVSSSWPQYYPYFKKVDSRGRTRTYQRTTKHTYQVIIQLDKLSINVPVKLRTGTNKKPIQSISPSLIKSKKNPYGQYQSLGDFIAQIQGVNLDHFFRLEHIRAIEGCLFGKDLCGSTPNDVKVPFLSKHEYRVLEVLLEHGILSK